MGLTAEYDDDFERCWKVYPKWPAGRSRKQPSYVTFQKVRKQLKFTATDIGAIVSNIEARVLNCETWQTGNKFGPPMFSTYFNQHLWNEPYEKKGAGHWSGRMPDNEDNRPAWQQRGYQSDEAYRAALQRSFEEAKAKRMGLH